MPTNPTLPTRTPVWKSVVSAPQKTNLEEGRLGFDSDNYGVFMWWPHHCFYTYSKFPGGLTEKEYLTGVHEFVL